MRILLRLAPVSIRRAVFAEALRTPVQLLLVDPVALDFRHCALVVEVIDGAVDFGTEVVVVLEKFELTRGVSAEGSSRRDGGGLEGFDVLMVVSVYHPVDQGVFAVFDFDILHGFHFAAGESDVEGDVVSAFVQHVPFRDFRSWSIIFPSSPRVNRRPFVG